MNKIFFFLYNYYYKRGNPDPRMDPVPQASWVIAICITGWIVFIDNVFSFFFKYKIDIFYHGVVAASIGLIFGGIIRSYYIDINRINLLYEKYSNLTANEIKRSTILTFISIFIPYILAIIWFIIFG